MATFLEVSNEQAVPRPRGGAGFELLPIERELFLIGLRNDRLTIGPSAYNLIVGVLGGVSGVLAGFAFVDTNPSAMVVFGAIFVLGAPRLGTRVVALPDVLRVRNAYRRHRLPLAEIVAFDVEEERAFGATTSVGAYVVSTRHVVRLAALTRSRRLAFEYHHRERVELLRRYVEHHVARAVPYVRAMAPATDLRRADDGGDQSLGMRDGTGGLV